MENFDSLWSLIAVQRSLPVLIVVCASACDLEIDVFCEANPEADILALTSAAIQLVAPLYLGPEWKDIIKKGKDESDDDESKADPT